MIPRRASIAVALLLVFTGFASRAEKAPPASAFASLPLVTHVRVSPKGDQIAYLVNLANETVLTAQTLGAAEREFLLRSENEVGQIAWFDWANNDLLLIGATFPSYRDGVKVTVTGLLGIKRGDPKPRVYLEPRLEEHRSQFRDRVIDFLPDDPDHVLVELDAESPTLPTVYRLDLNTGKKTLVEHFRQPIRGWITDMQGRVRVGVGYNEGEVSIIARGAGSKKWKLLLEYEALAEPSTTVLGFGADPNRLYLRAPHRGRNSIFTLDLDSGERTLVAHDEQYDINGELIVSVRLRDVVGVHHKGEDGSRIYWHEDLKALQRAVDRALPDTHNLLVDFSNDERTYIAFATSDVVPGTYYYGNRDAQALTPFADVYPELSEHELSGKELLTYQARDGLEIEAFLTRPWGNPPRPWPTVILPHGGPVWRVSGDFDYEAEFLASRGYAVLQMNFRGSSGYGWDFEQSGFGDIGGAMQDDVVDGARWMIAEGLADPRRMCVMGGSYGGYVALWGAIQTPELFRCAISINGVSDWARVLADGDRFLFSEAWRKQLGKRSDLNKVSPLRRAADVGIPVLLVHGESDRTVPVEHSRRMARALQSHGKVYEYVELPHGTHALANAANRTTCLEAVERFLALHLAALPPEKPATAGGS